MSKQPVRFHEGLPEFIRSVPPNGVQFLATIIKNTKIPLKAIPGIEKLWIAKCRELRMGTPSKELSGRSTKNGIGDVWKADGPDYFGVPEALQEQRKRRVTSGSSEDEYFGY